ncbi:hypothetical protein KIL84_007047 [Mauremys mutica]|uniref:Uncharacterized protein n=1 Tax=Mauremys mutica TaxID=74926 RepID=A0A9D3WWN5_9SAUR|nr:hypothetical protein KIL84_007047 [Mauremys mutica]
MEIPLRDFFPAYVLSPSLDSMLHGDPAPGFLSSLCIIPQPGLHAPWRFRSGISFQPMYYPPAWTPAPWRPTRLLDLLGWSPFPIGLQLQAFLQRTNPSGLSINFLNRYD